MTKPRIFIGSSTEGLRIAQVLEQIFEYEASIELWTSDIFKPGYIAIDSLAEQLDSCNFAIFILTPDDSVVSRGQSYQAPRDNVIFEAGLFIGRLGRERTFLVYERGVDIKIPSDLAGVINITFDGSRFEENPTAALSPVANKIRHQFPLAVDPVEIDFISAYLTFIQPETSLGDTHSEILLKQYDTLNTEVKNLVSRRDWNSLLAVKVRLREFFEYSGHYMEGVDFGRRYIKALEEQGNTIEALWAKVKHVAYLLILSGNHGAGRKLLQEVISALENLSPRENELLFYCYRYLAISFHRDKTISIADGMDKANQCLAKAESAMAAIQDKKKRQEAEARLLTNKGNLMLGQERIKEARAFYQKSLELFTELNDEEHIGISYLKLAQAMLREGITNNNCARHLENAFSIFMRLGWIEGQARVWEERAERFRRLASRAKKNQPKAVSHLLLEMEYHSKQARILFERINHGEGIGRIDALLNASGRTVESI